MSKRRPATNQNGETMEDDDAVAAMMNEMFRPVDEESLDYLHQIINALEAMNDDPANLLTRQDRETLLAAASNILLLSSKALAGYALYSEFRSAGINMHDEYLMNRLTVSLEDPELGKRLPDTAILAFETLIEDGLDLGEFNVGKWDT